VSPELFFFLFGALAASALLMVVWFLRRMRADQARDEEWATGPLPILPPAEPPYPPERAMFATSADVLAHGRHRR
jgi:hypothetical protein